MTTTSQGRERRKHPRAKADLPITLCLDGSYHEANLRDVSASGVCFHIDRPIEEMSVLSMQLDLPQSVAGEGAKQVKGEGVVVRCMRISPSLEHYEVAVFFHQLDQADLEGLERYVAARD